jgi:flagellar hook-associated protein 1 FlgK
MIQEVSSIIDTKVLHHDDGTVTVVVASGMPLVEGGEARAVRVDPGSAPGEAMVQMEGSGSLWLDMNERIGGGSLAGLLTARDVDLDAIESRLDQLAYDIANAVNAQHAAGVGLDGVGGRDLFAPPAVVDGAASLLSIDAAVEDTPDAVAAATVAGLSGDNRNALALAALSTTSFAAGGTATATEEQASILGMTGAMARQAQDQAETRQAAEAQTVALMEQQVGVSIDEEMIDLIAYEKAYQAASKLVALADGLFETVLAMKR